jgi:hypothetical protein
LSTNTPTKSISLTPRAVEAVWRAAEELSATDLKRLASAMIEIASEELRTSDRFAGRVRVLYDSLAPVKAARNGSTRNSRPAQPKLVPIKRIEGREIDLGAPPDPYFLNELYGSDQLQQALAAYPVKALQEAVEIMQERQPSGRPKGKTKTALVEYLVRSVVSGAA